MFIGHKGLLEPLAAISLDWVAMARLSDWLVHDAPLSLIPIHVAKEMARPSLAWAGYNLFRLIAVVFLIWAFVAQFLALAADMNAMDKNGSVSPSVTVASEANGVQSTSVDLGATTASTSTSSSAVIPTTAPTDTTTATRTGTSLTAVILDTSIPEETTTTTATTAVVGGGGAITATDEIPAIVDGGSPRMRQREVEPRSDDTADESTGWIQDSGIPDQPGGVGFAILSRLIIAVILFGLVFVQIGWPEDILYHLAPWFGPQSTPMSLGTAQLILAVENLRIYEKASYRIPSWALLVIGALNIIFGGILRVVSRRMPPRPPPALWFNLSHRFFFWRPVPNCYQQLFQRPQDPEDEDDDNEKGDVEEGLVPYAAPDQPSEESATHSQRRRDRSERSRAHHGRSRSKREREREERHAERRRQKEERPPDAHTDVRQGGYPTFSGRDASSGGRQVPTGTLERSMDGREVFVSEDGRTTVHQRLPQGRFPAASPPHMAQTNEVVRPRERKRAITPPRPLSLSRSNVGEPVAAPESSTLPPTAKSSTINDQITQGGAVSAGGTGGVSREVSIAGARHRQAQQEEQHKSLVAATKELGPHFPLPPSRAGPSGPPPVPTSDMGENKTARIEVRQASESQQNARRPPSAILTSPSGPNAPASSAAPVLRRPPQRQSTSLSAAPTTAPLPTRQPAKPLASVLETPDEDDDALAYDKASLDDTPREKERARKARELSSGNPSATASAPSKRARAQQASNVRFELSPLSEVSEGSASDVEPESAKIQTGIRIPGLGMTLPSLPFTLGSFNTPARESTLEVLDPAATTGTERSPSRERKEERRPREKDGDDTRKGSKTRDETSSRSSESSRSSSRSKERERAKRSERGPRERRGERDKSEADSKEGSERSSRSRRIKEKVLSLVEPDIPKEPLPDPKRRPSSTLDIPNA